MLKRSTFYCFSFISLCLSAWYSPLLAEETTKIPEKGSFGLGWLDQTHAVASNSANTVADKIDRFFGEPRSDLEAAYSSLRLSIEQHWRENEGSNSKLRLRGKVYLPRINERVSVLFSDDEGEGTDVYDQNNAQNPTQESTKANLQFNFIDSVRKRLDVRVGLRSSLKAKASIRYRYELPRGESVQHRLVHTFAFIDGDGFGSLTRYELDKSLNDTSLLRWRNDLRFEEKYSGSQWSSQLSYSKALTDNTALAYYTRVNGQTATRYLPSYDVGFRVRKNIGRPWLFFELEPGHAWIKRSEQTQREKEFFLFLRLEAAIGRN